jgi:precorrin isomerase
MRVTSEGRPVDAETMASRLRFSPDFADKLANELQPGTTVIVTDYTVVRKKVAQSDVFATN